MLNCLDWVGDVGLCWVVVERTSGSEDGLADDDLLAGDQSVGGGREEVELSDWLTWEVGEELRRRWREGILGLLRVNILQAGGVPGVVTNGGCEAAISRPELWDLIKVHLVEDEGGLERDFSPGDFPITVEYRRGHYLVFIEISLENNIQILRPRVRCYNELQFMESYSTLS